MWYVIIWCLWQTLPPSTLSDTQSSVKAHFRATTTLITWFPYSQQYFLALSWAAQERLVNPNGGENFWIGCLEYTISALTIIHDMVSSNCRYLWWSIYHLKNISSTQFVNNSVIKWVEYRIQQPICPRSPIRKSLNWRHKMIRILEVGSYNVSSSLHCFQHCYCWPTDSLPTGKCNANRHFIL